MTQIGNNCVARLLKSTHYPFILPLFLLMWLMLYPQSVFADTPEVLQESSVQILGRGPVVPISKDQSLPISTMNVKWVDVDILKANNPAEFLPDHYFNQNIDLWDLGSLNQSFTSVFTDRYNITNNETNQQISSRIKIPSSLTAGWYVMVLKPAGDYQSSKIQIRHVLLTDIGLQAKVYQNSIHIRAATLVDGKVLAKGIAKLYRNGKLVETTSLDTTGQANFVKMPTAKDDGVKNDVIYLQSGQHITYLALKEIPLDLSEFSIGGEQYEKINAFVYSNRDLIRPGDTLPIHILLKDDDGKSLSTQPLSIRLLNSEQAEIFNKRIQPTQEGYYADKITTDRSWPMGRYTLEIRTNPKSSKPLQIFRFQMEEFTPERMDLTITSENNATTAGDNIVYQLYGKYLFGTPASNNVIKANVNYQSTQHFPGQYNAFFVGEDFSLEENYKELPDLQLDAEGKASIKIPTPADVALKSPVYAKSDFSLLETGGAAVQRKQQQIIWRDLPIPALRPDTSTFTYDSQATFDIALLNAQGDSTTEGQIDLTFERDQGRYYWVYEEGDGWSRHEQSRWKTLETRRISVKDVSQVQFPVSWGDYKLTLKDPSTDVITVYEFYAGWYAGDEQQQAKPDQITINLDKSSYHNGDTINATIDAPAAGDMTIAVESDHPLWDKTFSIEKGQQTITIPVDATWNRHDLYITSLLTSQVENQPKRYFGIKALKLDREYRKLGVSVDLPKNIRPLTQATIPVHVNQNATTQDTWVTLSMVDKGIINLSRFQPQNPFDFFYGQRRYQADVIDLYSRLYDTRPDPFASSRFGSDLVQRTNNKNDDLAEIKTITWMSTAVKVIDGVASFTVDIPDYNGEVQIIATAFNDQQYGQNVSDTIVAASTVVELGAPKFFAPGDISSLAVDITNKSDSDQRYTLTISASNPSINITGESQVTVDLKDQKRTSFRFPLEVANTFDHLDNTFTLTVTNADGAEQKIEIARSWTIPIRPVVPLITMKHQLVLKPNEQYIVDEKLWQSMYWLKDNPGYLTASYSSMINIDSQLASLFHYPYGCSEQVTSTASPFLYESPLLEQSKQRELKKQGHTATEALAVAVQKLAQRQLQSGGFSLWDSSSEEDYWVTVYATEFLLKVKQQAPTLVSDTLIDSALARVTSYAQSPSIVSEQTAYKGQSEAIIAYAIYLASANGKLSWNDINNAIDYVQPWPSKLAKLQVAASYANVGSFDDAQQLLSSLDDLPRHEHYFADYGSRLRDNAVAVTIFKQLGEIDSIASQVQLLKSDALNIIRNELGRSDWLSTQENNAIVQAGLIVYADNQDNVSIKIDDQSMTSKGMITFEAMPKQVINNNGNKNLLIEILAQGYPDDLAKVPSTLTSKNAYKTLSYLDGKPYTGNPLQVGERLVVKVSLQPETSVNDALLVDLIPAGFSLENPNLNQGPNITNMLGKDFVLSESQHSEYRADRFVASTNLEQGNIAKFAYIIRAEAPGIYQVPSTQIESMYNPDLRLIISPSEAKITIKERSVTNDKNNAQGATPQKSSILKKLSTKLTAYFD
jgi:alpha-2-macroglobulin